MRDIVLFVHILAVIALLGPIFLVPLISASFKGKPPNAAITVISMIDRQAMQSVPIILATGFWLVSLSDAKWGLWLIASIVLTVAIGAIGFFVNKPKMTAAISAMRAGNDLNAIVALRVPVRITIPIMALATAITLYLSIAKPGA
jgi:Predicted integral membrane protein (DUF2269)